MAKPRTSAFIALIISVTVGTPVCPQAVPDYQMLESGLDYKVEKIKEGPVAIHVLRIDRARKDWQWIAPLGEVSIMGLNPLPNMILDTARWQNGRPIAAINGDWFEIKAGPYQGDPRGLQIVDGGLVSAPVTGYAAFWINAHGEPQMGAVQPRLRLVWPPNKSEFPLGLNEHRTDDRAVLYTPALGHKSSDFKSARQSTRTISGLELTLEPTDAKAWLPFEPGKRYSARVAKVDKNGDSALGPKTAVISLGPQLLKIFPQVAVGDQLTLNLDTDPDLSGVKTAIGGGFQLLKLGKKLQLEKADNVRHPRSMLGWNRTHYFLVVVDGRQPKHSIGMTYFELAGLGARLECTDAMALDGGGSSTLWADGRVLNSPSDGKLRAVANALILLERKANVSPR